MHLATRLSRYLLKSRRCLKSWLKKRLEVYLIWSLVVSPMLRDQLDLWAGQYSLLPCSRQEDSSEHWRSRGHWSNLVFSIVEVDVTSDASSDKTMWVLFIKSRKYFKSTWLLAWRLKTLSAWGLVIRKADSKPNPLRLLILTLVQGHSCTP